MELNMTLKEADRYSKMKEVESKKISLKSAAKALSISYRQATRNCLATDRKEPKE